LSLSDNSENEIEEEGEIGNCRARLFIPDGWTFMRTKIARVFTAGAGEFSLIDMFSKKVGRYISMMV
jgi:hypothetical protein